MNKSTMQIEQERLLDQLNGHVTSLAAIIDDYSAHMKALRYQLVSQENMLLLASAALRAEGSPEDRIVRAQGYLQMAISTAYGGNE